VTILKLKTMPRGIFHILSDLKNVHQELEQMKGQDDALDKLRQSLEPKLRSLDAERIDQNIEEHDGEIPAGQTELLDELKQCSVLVEEIKANQSSLQRELHTIKKELKRLLERSSLTLQDLIPYQNRLRTLESKRVDGFFLASAEGEFPADQAKLNKLLAECHKLKEQILDKIKVQGLLNGQQTAEIQGQHTFPNSVTTFSESSLVNAGESSALKAPKKREKEKKLNDIPQFRYIPIQVHNHCGSVPEDVYKNLIKVLPKFAFCIKEGTKYVFNTVEYGTTSTVAPTFCFVWAATSRSFNMAQPKEVSGECVFVLVHGSIFPVDSPPPSIAWSSFYGKQVSLSLAFWEDSLNYGKEFSDLQ